jgi:hypothetical protein
VSGLLGGAPEGAWDTSGKTSCVTTIFYAAFLLVSVNRVPAPNQGRKVVSVTEKNMTDLQVNHLEIAARTWAADKSREIAGTTVDHVLTRTGSTHLAPNVINEIEDHMQRWLAAWLKNNLLEFTRTYMREVEERALHVEKLLDERLALIPTAPVLCGQKDRDARILAESNMELFAALKRLCNATDGGLYRPTQEDWNQAEAAIKKAES